MDGQTQLITVYLTVCDLYRKGLWVYGQRFAPYSDLRFTDEEVITLYLCGLLDGKCPIKTLYEHARRYWRDWFPHLPSYGGFVQRLNRLADVFPALLEHWSPAGASATPIGVADSFPVVLARQTRRSTAKVAPDLAASGYCSAKKLYDHGVKIHVIGDEQPGTLPRPR